MTPPLHWFLIFSAVLFCIGMAGVLVRRHVLVIFMSVELMLNGSNVALVAVGRHFNTLAGQAFVVFVITVAAAEAAVGLAIILALARQKDTVDVGDMDMLRE